MQYFREVVAGLRKDVTDLGEKVSHTENTIEEQAEVHNNMTDAFKEMEQKLQACTEKINNLEDRSR
ncbi:Hypothetical predicted protein, partial [Pelobates cultripes]